MKLFNTLLILFLGISFNTSCKKTASSQVSVPTDTIVCDTIFRETAVIQYTKDVSLSALWDYNRAMSEASVMHTSYAGNGSVFVMTEIKEKHFFQYIDVLELDAQGNVQGEVRVKEPKDVKYQFYDSFIIPQKNEFPTYYILAEHRKRGIYAPEGNEDIEKTLLSLDRYSLDRLIFGKSVVDYQTRSVSLKQLLNDFVIKNQISRFRNIKLRRYDDKIFLYGDVGVIKGHWWGCPFVVILTDDLKVFASKVYTQEGYQDTYIENISIDKDNRITIEGDKQDSADGWYYSTHIRFVTDRELNILRDESDSEPYHSYYRGPSAPDYTEEDTEENDVETEDVEETQPVEAVVEDTHTTFPETTERTTEKFFYTGDASRKTYYSLTYNEEDITDVVLKKMNGQDSTLILKRTFLLGKDYSPQMLTETPDGGFILAFSGQYKVGTGESYEKNAYQSNLLLFRFNKQGNLSHQYETSRYIGSVGYFYLSSVKDNRIIATFMVSNSYFDGDWHYPQQLRIVAFPL